MCMRPELTVIPDHILRDALFRFVERCVTDLGDPFRIQASEEALNWTDVPTVAAPTHALQHLIPPLLLPERQAGVLAAGGGGGGGAGRGAAGRGGRRRRRRGRF